MSPWLAPLLRLISLIVDQIKLHQARRQKERRNREQTEIQSDPVAFGRDHFNRMRDVPDTADTTSDAGAGKLDDKRSGRRES